MEMINRFRGEEGHDRRISALRQQIILHNNEPLIKELTQQVNLIQFESCKATDRTE